MEAGRLLLPLSAVSVSAAMIAGALAWRRSQEAPPASPAPVATPAAPAPAPAAPVASSAPPPPADDGAIHPCCRGAHDPAVEQAMSRASKDPVGALELLDREVSGREPGPAAARAQYHRGWLRQRLGDLEGALGDASRAIELDPRVASHWFQRGQIRRERGDHQGALGDFSKAVELAPEWASAWNSRGATRARLKQDEGALADYDRSIELDPRRPVVRRNRASARGRRGDLEGALEEWDQVVALEPDVARNWLGRAAVREALKDADGAKADRARAKQLDPSKAPIRLSIDADDAGEEGTAKVVDEVKERLARATRLGKEGKHKEALPDLDRLIALGGDRNAVLWERRAEFRRRTGDLVGARKDADRALELDSKLVSAWVERGQIRQLQGDEGARADFDRAVELDPDDAAARMHRGVWLALKKDYAAALADFDRLVAVDPRRGVHWHLRGTARRQSGDRQGAIPDLEKALELDPDAVWAALDRKALEELRSAPGPGE